MFEGRLTSILGAGLMGWTVLASLPVKAANEAMMELLKVLRENGTLSEETYEQLQSAAKADDESNTQGQAEVKSAAQNLPKIETKGKLEWSTPEGDFKWRLGGRIHADAAFYDNDTSTTGEPTGLDDGVDFRRARLVTEATLWRSWQFKFEYDFADDGGVDSGLRDVYLRYLFWGSQPYITVGQFKEYFSLESWSSSNDITFIERALPSRAFSPPDGRRLGVGVSTYGQDLWTLSAGVYGKNASGEDIGGVEIEDDPDPLVFVGRLTFSPFHTETRVVHLGASGSWLDSGNNLVEFRERPEAAIGAERLIDTGEFDVDTLTRYGVEALAIYGPFSVQGEYLLAHVERDLPGEPDVSFPGWYVYGSWILTGESRVYDFVEGRPKNPKPKGIVGKGGIGAWEIAARYSTLDLNDEDIDGGEEENVTVGLNWYPTPVFKFMANYVKVLDIEGGEFNDAEPDIFQLRAQAYW